MKKHEFLVVVAAGLLAVAPVAAQHGGHGGQQGHQGHQDHQGAMAGQMGDMHSTEMMEQMTTMMDHMTDMVGSMHEYQQQLGEMLPEHAGSDHAGHLGMMQAMAANMDEILPHMEAMLDHMRSTAADTHGDGSTESMAPLMERMDTMLEAGRDVMVALHGMAGENHGEAAATDHSGHDH